MKAIIDPYSKGMKMKQTINFQKRNVLLESENEVTYSME